jgi:hypothetical protein
MLPSSTERQVYFTKQQIIWRNITYEEIYCYGVFCLLLFGINCTAEEWETPEDSKKTLLVWDQLFNNISEKLHEITELLLSPPLIHIYPA